MVADPLNLIWIDLEMTGLMPDLDRIIEIATVVTDKELNVIAEGPVFAIHQDDHLLDGMDDWNTRQHSKSGLTQRVRESKIREAMAERETIAFLQQHVLPSKSPMCGNSICQDRRFMHRLMPGLESWFHYRNLDVSTLKELASRWLPAAVNSLEKQNLHRALADIRESVAELRHYRQFMGEFSGLDQC